MNLAGKQVRLHHFEELMAAPELWDDQALAADILRERASLIQATEEYVARHQRLEDLGLFLDMALEEDDHQILKDVARDLTAMEREFSDWELKLLLGAKRIEKNAIVTIHAGAGGHRGRRLGPDVAAYVPALRRAQGFQDRDHRPFTGGRGGRQVRHLGQLVHGSLCLRLFEERKRHPPPGAHLAV